MEWGIALKIADKQFFHASSIKTRLFLFYSIAVFVLLTLFATFLYWVTINVLYKADYQFLADEVDTIQYILENDPVDMEALRQEIISIPIEPNGSIYRYYIRVVDPDKRIMLETPGMSEILLPEKSMTSKNDRPSSKRYIWYTTNNNHYLIVEAPMHFGKSMRYGTVQIMQDITYQHRFINDRKKIIGSLFVVILLALSLGFLIANRGLRSLYLLTETVQKITATSLNNRIDPNLWPKELRGLSLAFNQMLDRVESSFLRLKQFSADLAHELRTPITNLVGETEVALSYAKTSEEYQAVLVSNLEELQRMSSLIENMLFLARAESPHQELSKINLSVHEEIEVIKDYYEMMADDKDIRITSIGSATVSANPEMFRRMLGNLLSNAIKYTNKGGLVEFQVKEFNNQVEIIVQDNGIGIDAKDIPKLFDRFYRVDAARSESPGIGLGLPIVKSIVDLHHGSILVKSEVGRGTSIVIHLPK